MTGRLLLTRINIHIGHCLMMPFRMGRCSRRRYRGNQKIIYCNRNIPPFEASFQTEALFFPVPNFTKQMLFPVKTPRVFYENINWYDKKFLHKCVSLRRHDTLIFKNHQTALSRSKDLLPVMRCFLNYLYTVYAGNLTTERKEKKTLPLLSFVLRICPY